MFQIGDAVVYPPYGGGYIRAVEEKVFLDKKETYHVIEFLLSRELNVYVPSKLLSEKNIRPALTKEQIQAVISNLNLLDESSLKIISITNQRYNNSSVQLTADIETTLSTFMTLRKKQQDDKLNQAEKNVYSKCHNMLVSELMASENMDEKEAENVLKELLNDYALQL